MAVTDIIISFISIFLLSLGTSRGFMRSLLGPFSIIVTTIISIIYYQITQNIMISLGIGLIGPMLLTFLLKFLLKTWAKATNNDIKLSSLSRLGGSILTLLWGWVFIVLTLILLAVLPPWTEALTAIHNDVIKSMSYSIAKPWKENFYGASPSDAKSLAQDPRFQKVLQDPEIQEEINAHDIVKLMSNPKMINLTKQIMSDPATMKKVMAVYSSQTQSSKSP